MNDKTQTVKITVYQPGTHAGKRYTPGPEGHTFEVTPAQAEFLRKAGADKRPGTERDAAKAIADVPMTRTAVATRPQG